jgi:hypothetical protein
MLRFFGDGDGAEMGKVGGQYQQNPQDGSDDAVEEIGARVAADTHSSGSKKCLSVVAWAEGMEMEVLTHTRSKSLHL